MAINFKRVAIKGYFDYMGLMVMCFMMVVEVVNKVIKVYMMAILKK